MPCYSHTCCHLCDIPIWPDCIGDDSPDLLDEKYCWINSGVVIYEGKKKNKVFTIAMNNQGNLGVLYDKYNENKRHEYNAKILHTYCYKLLKHNKEKIKKWINIWYFLEFFINENRFRLIDNVALRISINK